MRKFFCAIIFPVLLSACAAPLPAPDDDTLRAEVLQHDVAATQIVAQLEQTWA